MKVRSGRRAESELTERQRHWLGHLRAAQRKDEPLTVYAEQRGLSVSSVYEAKRQPRQAGNIEEISWVGRQPSGTRGKSTGRRLWSDSGNWPKRCAGRGSRTPSGMSPAWIFRPDGFRRWPPPLSLS